MSLLRTVWHLFYEQRHMMNNWFPSRLKKTRFGDCHSSPSPYRLADSSIVSIANFETSANDVNEYLQAQEANDWYKTPIYVPIPSQTINAETFDGFSLVSLDPVQNDFLKYPENIDKDTLFKAFGSEGNKCVDFIDKQGPNKRIFLIASGRLGEWIVPRVHYLPQIYAVYIFCADIAYHSQWAHQFHKVRIVTSSEWADLDQILTLDMAHANMEWGDALLKAKKPDLALSQYEKPLKGIDCDYDHHRKELHAQVKTKIFTCQLFKDRCEHD